MTFRRLRYLFLAGERLDPDTYHTIDDPAILDEIVQTLAGSSYLAATDDSPLEVGAADAADKRRHAAK